ncbi:hypothetical protein BGX20_001602 [Mortierella sp. AD010]|nr:hypothetical protein BGX20_001602 [Mortierella sp. AD010]
MGNGSSRDQEDAFDNEGKSSHASINLFQFKFLRVIGKGSFGKVRMVERRETGKVYALKYISKEQVIKMEAVRNILRERQILESVDHTFVVNMRFAFQDDEYMYMCMDLMMGGDLRFHMNRRNFAEDVVRFWIAETSSAVAYLHTLGIVHRDIKPDNILLDERGHAHITDFNISCKLTPEKPFLTSQSGTVAYMAPEVFKGTGYGTSVDWWALGVIFYECIYNQRPFLTENIGELKRAITNQTIEYPHKETISQECVSMIQGLLIRDPAERLGVRGVGGIDEIKLQPFFRVAANQAGMSPDQWWHMLETKQLTPKFQPPAEAANFDATYDLEELLLDEDPLSYRSTRERAQRLRREKNEAIKQENARRKAEHDAAMAAEKEAQAAMEAMNRELEQSMRKINSPRLSSSSILSKKKSVLHLFGGDSGNKNSIGCEDSRQPAPQTQPSSVPPHQSPKSHTPSQLSRQTQFQSIPLSPIDSTSNGSRELPPSPLPTLRFPPATTTLDQSVSQYHYPPTPPKIPNSTATGRDTSESKAGPFPMDKNLMDDNNDPTRSRRRDSGQSSKDIIGVQALPAPSPLMPSAMSDRQLSQEHLAATLPQQQQHPFQAAHPQMAISSPVIIPTPLDHSVSRHKHIPTQQPQPQPQPPGRYQPGVGPRRPISPSPALNIAAEAAAAAAMADMTEEERFEYQLDLIDREFTTFDYTVFENYHGLVDPVTMSVGDPPEWVRSRD